jgi:hypothetical protein
LGIASNRSSQAFQPTRSSHTIQCHHSMVIEAIFHARAVVSQPCHWLSQLSCVWQELGLYGGTILHRLISHGPSYTLSGRTMAVTQSKTRWCFPFPSLPIISLGSLHVSPRLTTQVIETWVAFAMSCAIGLTFTEPVIRKDIWGLEYTRAK